mgnify:FL=1
MINLGQFPVGIFDCQIDQYPAVGLELDRPVNLAPNKKQSSYACQTGNKPTKASRKDLKDSHIESPQLQKEQAFEN